MHQYSKIQCDCKRHRKTLPNYTYVHQCITVQIEPDHVSTGSFTNDVNKVYQISLQSAKYCDSSSLHHQFLSHTNQPTKWWVQYTPLKSHDNLMKTSTVAIIEQLVTLYSWQPFRIMNCIFVHWYADSYRQNSWEVHALYCGARECFFHCFHLAKMLN